MLSLREQLILEELESDFAGDRSWCRWGRAVRVRLVGVWRLRWVLCSVLLVLAGTVGLSVCVVLDRVGWGVLAGAAGWSAAAGAVARQFRPTEDAPRAR
ncbi:hypothetical protein GCM10018781_61160 [Kitasatospora indigofera]|uniref:DUF3040 domain-containing protein n=1 Tax=Kitasatospora indigofera TaxID=67307 RepID=A0A919L2K5_9ACTN|nr:hypothetical protein GCM10018781_61160 [Kitasatospora indigofera]